MTSWRVIEGDCVEAMRAMPEASVDAVICDPPYDLTAGKRGGTGAASINLDSPYGRARIGTGNGAGGFMGKAWDGTGVAFTPATWTEALRVLKPGGHLLAFGGTRTYHRLTCAVEDAGFEIRDCLAWLYGSGFPKSLDVSKAIDKCATENTETTRRIAAVAAVIREYRERAGMTPQQVSASVVGTPSGACWNWEHQQLPSIEMWPKIKAVLSIPDEFDGLIEGDRARFIAAERAVVGMRTTGIGTGKGSTPFIGDGENRDLTAPATRDAERWQGWGTALKPAHEPIVLARKPLTGTVAGNVLAHGTGALNVDGCRIGPDTANVRARAASTDLGIVNDDGWQPKAVQQRSYPDAATGRWPANVVLDPEAAAMLDEMTGDLHGAGTARDASEGTHRGVRVEGWGNMGAPAPRFGDTGGASRFFYVAKADTAERNTGLHGQRNSHPTVKPVALMRWLCRLVTPPGGTILDPFTGSGTTGIAALREGFAFVGIEREAEYVAIARARIIGDAPLINGATELAA